MSILILFAFDALQPGWARCAGLLGVAQRTAHTICLADCGWSSGKRLTSQPTGTAFCRIFVSQDLHISVGHAAEPARMMSGRGTCPSEHIGAGALCATLSGQTLSTSVDCDPPLVCCTVYSCTCEMSEPSRGGLPPRNTAHACSLWKLRKSPSPKRPRAWPSRRFARVRVQALSACVAYWDADFLSRYAQRIARASEGHVATCGNMWRHVATGHVEVRGRWPRAP